MTMSDNIFSVGAPRPVYTPIAITCPSCGAGLTKPLEQAQLIVCQYCDERVDCTEATATALGKGPSADKFFYKIPLNAVVTHQGEQYRIIGRMTQMTSYNGL